MSSFKCAINYFSLFRVVLPRKKQELGVQLKSVKKGGRIVCRAANKLRFGTLKLLIKAIVKIFGNPMFAKLESNI